MMRIGQTVQVHDFLTLTTNDVVVREFVFAKDGVTIEDVKVEFDDGEVCRVPVEAIAL